MNNVDCGGDSFLFSTYEPLQEYEVEALQNHFKVIIEPLKGKFPSLGTNSTVYVAMPKDEEIQANNGKKVLKRMKKVIFNKHLAEILDELLYTEE